MRTGKAYQNLMVDVALLAEGVDRNSRVQLTAD